MNAGRLSVQLFALRSIASDDRPRYPALGLWRLIAYARTDPTIRERCDFSVHQVEHRDQDRDETNFICAGADVIGISCVPWSTAWALRLAGQALASSDALVVLGGLTAPQVLRSLSDHPRSSRLAVVHGVQGFAEPAFRGLLLALLERRPARPRFEAVPGLQWLAKGTVRSGRPPAPVSAAEIPSPYLGGLMPLDPVYDYFLVAAGMGCRNSCTYCTTAGTARAFRRGAERSPLGTIGDELRLAAALGFNSVSIFDAEVNQSTERFFRILDRVHFDAHRTVFLYLGWNHFDAQQLRTLRRYYCDALHVAFGVQTLNPAVFPLIRRTTAHLDRFCSVIPELASNCRVGVDLMLGLPGDTERSFLSAVGTFLRLGAEVRVHHLSIPVGTELERQRDEFGLVTKEMGGMEVVLATPTFPAQAIERCIRQVGEMSRGAKVAVESPLFEQTGSQAKRRAAGTGQVRTGMGEMEMLRRHLAAWLPSLGVAVGAEPTVDEAAGCVRFGVVRDGKTFDFCLAPASRGRTRAGRVAGTDFWYRHDGGQDEDDAFPGEFLGTLAEWLRRK
jgi:hypothetical protein